MQWFENVLRISVGLTGLYYYYLLVDEICFQICSEDVIDWSVPKLS